MRLHNNANQHTPKEGLIAIGSCASPTLRGAVTTGELWKFGEFHRQTRQIVEDRTLYQVPDDLELVFRALIAMTQSSSD